MATDRLHSTSLLTVEEKGNGPNFILSLVIVGIFLTILAFVSLSIQCRRLKSARQHRKEQKKQQLLDKTSTETFSAEQFRVELRRKHNQEYRELAAQLNDMKQMQNDVKLQLAGLQALAKRISKKTTSNSASSGDQTNPSEIKKQN